MAETVDNKKWEFRLHYGERWARVIIAFVPFVFFSVSARSDFPKHFGAGSCLHRRTVRCERARVIALGSRSSFARYRVHRDHSWKHHNPPARIDGLNRTSNSEGLRFEHCRDLLPVKAQLEDFTVRTQFRSVFESPNPRSSRISIVTDKSALLVTWEKELNRLVVESRKLKQINHINTPLAGFAFRQVRVRPTQHSGDFALGHPGLFPSLDQQPQKCIVCMLMRSRPGLSRFPGFAGTGLAHLSSL